MASTFPPDLSQPIPNNPFFYPNTNYVRGEYGPFIVGAGIFVDNATGTISAGGTGPGGITTLIGGVGINVSPNVGGIVTVTNTGVVGLTAGSGIQIVNNAGNYTIINSAPATAPTGTVTQVNAGAGLVGGPITTSGTLSLSPSGVAAGTYSNPTLIIDSYGRITFATPGTPSGTTGIIAIAPLQATSGVFPQTLSILPASTSASGAVRLSDSVTSTSSTEAATSRAVSQINSLATTANTNANTALTNSSTALTAANNALSTATTAQTCALQALTNAAIAQNDATQALNDAAAAQATADTALSTATGAQTTANSALASANNRIPCSAFTAKGSLLAGFSAGSYESLPPGTNGQVLVVCATCSSGLTWSSPSVGSVTQVDTGVGLIGGPITSTGTVSLADTAVNPGSYTLASITVDQQGRLTAASTGVAPVTSVSVTSPAVNTGTASDPIIGVQTATTGQLGAVQVGTNIDVAAGVISVASATTTNAGIVQLNDTVTSNSTTEALTANQGLALQTQIDALSVTTNLTLAGTFDASAAQMLSVTSAGTTAGFTVGSDLPAPAAGLTDYFVIVTREGSYSPPGVGGPFAAVQGDWFLCDGTVWQFLNVGNDFPTATTATAGIVELANSTETQAGTDATLAVTPASAAATYVPIADFSAKGDLLSATAANTQVALPVGGDGEILTACAAATTGLCWAPAAVPAIPCSVLTTKGDIITTSTPDTPVVLSAGADGEVLTACASSSTGLCWAPASVPAIPCSCITAKGALVTGTAASAPTALTVGGDGDVLVACSACAEGMTWATATADVPCAAYTAAGDILGGTGAGTFTALSVGTDGQLLAACAAAPNGLCWVAPTADIPCSVLTAKGDILLASGDSTPTALAVGSDGDFLVACSTAPDGVCWLAASYIPTSAVTSKGAILTATAASAVTALSVGADDLVLTACSAAPEGLCWAPVPGASPATPTTFGTVKGETISSATWLGCQAGGGVGSNCTTLVGYLAGSGGGSPTTDTGIGACTLTASSGGRNVAVGFRALMNGGTCNVAVGWSALRSASINAVRNTAVGMLAGCGLSDGDFNTFIGASAGRSITTGKDNTFVGLNAGCQLTGSGNTIIGGNAGLTLNSGLDYYTLIGTACKGAFFGPTATSWSFSSDERLKTDITALPVKGEQVVNSLRPVEFTWLDRETKKPLEDGTHCAVGFIAQEVQKTLKDNGLDHITNLVSEGVDEYLGLEHTALIPFLVKAVQELSAKVAELEKKV